MADALSALKCLSRAHTDGFLFGQILGLEYKKKEEFHSLRLPLLGLTLLGGLLNLPGSSPGNCLPVH